MLTNKQLIQMQNEYSIKRLAEDYHRLPKAVQVVALDKIESSDIKPAIKRHFFEEINRIKATTVEDEVFTAVVEADFWSSNGDTIKYRKGMEYPVFV